MANWQHNLEHAVLSDIGLRRGNNQDSSTVVLASSQSVWQQRGHLFIVADGMGAHAAGELASKIAVDTIPLVYQKLSDRSPPEAILAAVEEANHQIHARGQASPEFRGMGTTCTSLLLLPQGALLAHAGDSRGYLLRQETIQQLTFDHSLVWEMRAGGQLPQNEVPQYIPKNVITRSLGPNAAVQVDLEGPFPLAVGDTFLLCSDGLSGQVQDEEIGMILRALPPQEAVRTLVDLANLRGGPDNITVIVARVAADAASAAGPGAKPPRVLRPVAPAVWAALAVLGLGGIGLVAVQPLRLIGFGALVGAAAVGVVALLQRYRKRPPAIQFDGRRLGRGPYTSTSAVPSAAFASRLADIARDLRQAASHEDWVIDWSQFNPLVDEAAAAANRGDFTQSVRQYCHAISFMMEQLKQRRNAAGRDSNVL